MILVGKNFRYKVYDNPKNNTYGFTLIDDVPKEVVIKIDFSCEKGYNKYKRNYIWMQLYVEFMKNTGEKLFSTDKLFSLNYLLTDLDSFTTAYKSGKKSFALLPSEPTGKMVVTSSINKIKLTFIDFDFYLLTVDITSEQLEVFMESLEKENQVAYTICACLPNNDNKEDILLASHIYRHKLIGPTSNEINPSLFENKLDFVMNKKQLALSYLAGHTTSYKALERMLKAGADINGYDVVGNTPLHLAAANNPRVGISKEIVKLGGKCMPNNQGKMPLDYGILYNPSPKIPYYFMMLLVGDIQPQINSALIHAVKVKRINLVKYLLKLGANADARDKLGNTAYFYAKNYACKPELINLLQENSSEVF